MAARIESLFTWSEPRSLAAFERRARAETTLLVVVAAFAALSVVVTVRRMEVLRQAEPATDLGTAARIDTVEDNAVRAVEPSQLEPSQLEATSRQPAPVATHEASEVDVLAVVAAEVRPINARSERELYAEFVSLENADELAARAEVGIAQPQSRAESMALLRALHDTQHPRANELFVRAASEFDPCGDAHSESVPRSAVHWLSQRANRDASARGTLESIATATTVPVDVRNAGARALIASAPEAELKRIEVLFAREREDKVFEGVIAALDVRRANRSPAIESLDAEPQE